MAVPQALGFTLEGRGRIVAGLDNADACAITHQLQSLQEPSKCRAKDFLPVVLGDGTVSNDDLIEIPIKYPLHRRAHASAICNSRPIKTCESATGVALY